VEVWLAKSFARVPNFRKQADPVSVEAEPESGRNLGDPIYALFFDGEIRLILYMFIEIRSHCTSQLKVDLTLTFSFPTVPPFLPHF
jgi:hypothetical protein